MYTRTTNTLIAILALFIIAYSVEAAPKMEIVPTEFDFGYAPQNSQISHIFWLKAIGQDSLKITKVTPGCGCTKAPLDKDVLAPGDSAKLEIIFSTKSYQNRVTKSPSIETNEGDVPRKVQIVTHVVARPDSTYPVTVTPYKLDLSQFTDKVRDRIEFIVKNVSDQDLHLTLIDAPSEFFSVDLPEKVKAGQEVNGTVVLNEDNLNESFAKSMTFGLDDEKNSRFTIPVKRTVRTLSGK